MAVVSRIKDKETVESLVEVVDAFESKRDEILNIIRLSGALLKGHFELRPGEHSEILLRASDIASRLDWTKLFVELLFSQLSKHEIYFDSILTPDNAQALSGTVNYQTGKRMILVRSDRNGQATTDLVNETDLSPNDNILLVGNLMGYGRGLRSLIELVRSKGASPVAVILFAIKDRKTKNIFEIRTGVKVYSIIHLLTEERTWPKKECPLCEKDVPLLHTHEI